MMSLFIIMLMLALSAISVDVGMVASARSELQTAVDSVARHGANGLKSSVAIARSNVASAASDNAIFGHGITAADETIEFGTWDSFSRTFTVKDDDDESIDAIRYTVTLDADAGRGVETLFGRMIGIEQMTVEASAVARVNKVIEEITVPATANPWLAGSPYGTVANQLNPHGNPDYAGVVGSSGSPFGYSIPSSSIASLAFDSISGGSGFSSSKSAYSNADGLKNSIWNNRFATGKVRDKDQQYIDRDGDGKPDSGWNGFHNDDAEGTYGSENGKSDLIAPANSIIGIFLGPNGPIVGEEPDGLDFSTKSSRNFTKLSPKIAQPFFIGDGLNDNGVTQEFVIPEGATRLFFGVMDMYEWSNNVGGYSTSIKEYGKVSLVK